MQNPSTGSSSPGFQGKTTRLAPHPVDADLRGLEFGAFIAACPYDWLGVHFLMSIPSDYLTSLYSLAGKVAVVIGGTGELCGAMAEGLGAAGADAVLVGRNEKRRGRGSNASRRQAARDTSWPPRRARRPRSSNLNPSRSDP